MPANLPILQDQRIVPLDNNVQLAGGGKSSRSFGPRLLGAFTLSQLAGIL